MIFTPIQAEPGCFNANGKNCAGNGYEMISEIFSHVSSSVYPPPPPTRPIGKICSLIVFFRYRTQKKKCCDKEITFVIIAKFVGPRAVNKKKKKISKVYLGSCVQLYSLVETPQSPPLILKLTTYRMIIDQLYLCLHTIFHSFFLLNLLDLFKLLAASYFLHKPFSL